VTRITKHLVNLQNRISRACERAGRSVNEISILAVSKRHGVDAVHEAHAAGLTNMGENYLQEALQKIPQCSQQIVWHFIGRVQSNKTRALAENFDWVQTVDSQKIARRLSDQRPEHMSPLNVCVQVCIDNSSHGGAAPDEVAELCAQIAALPRVTLRGLMAIPLQAADEKAQRLPLRRLHQLYTDLQDQGFSLDTLSMGMTADLEAAILEGSTLLRVGTALFGPRPE